MKPNNMIVLLVFMISILITACSNNKNSQDLNVNSSNKTSTSCVPISPSPTPIDTQSDSKNKNHTVTAEKILNILSTKNNDVIDSLNLSDSDLIKSLDEQRFYVPVFKCEELGVLIGFNGANFDPIDKVKKMDETPTFVIPANGTIIRFDKVEFRVGDGIEDFKAKFGGGHAGKEGSLKGDKQYCYLTYTINNLKIRFTSLDGENFKKYDVEISKQENSSINNPAN